MAVVRSFTAERMLEIEQSTIVSGLVDSRGRLILKTRAGNDVDSGDVRGPAGPPGVGPTGTVSMFAGADAPEGHILCDGRAVSRLEFAALFAVIGTRYGAGNGSTTFNVPNLQGRVAVGADPNGIVNPNWGFNELGRVGGSIDHVLTVNEMPSHTHVQNAHTHVQNAHTHVQNAHTHVQDPHTHPFEYNNTQYPNWPLSNSSGNSVSFYVGGVSTSYPLRVSNGSATAVNRSTTATNQNTTATNQNTTATNQNTGGGQAHNNLQPYIVLNYIIRA